MDLRRQLENAGIDLSLWGTGQAKTLAHLQKEVDDGETALVAGDDGSLLREVLVCVADVYATAPDGKRYRLKEEKQVFKDGRVRRRDLGQAILEKMKPGEDPERAMVRGIKEELGLDVTVTPCGTEELTLASPSYPGLVSRYVRYIFAATLRPDQFRPEGYVETQSDKSTHFVWWEEVS